MYVCDVCDYVTIVSLKTIRTDNS